MIQEGDRCNRKSEKTIDLRVITQLRPWIFKNKPNLSPNFAKCLFHPWILQTFIKMVSLSKSSVSDDDVHVVLSCKHVNKEATCTMTNLTKMVKIAVLTFQLSFFLCFQLYPSTKDRFDNYCDNLRTDLLFTLFNKYINQGSHWYMLW